MNPAPSEDPSTSNRPWRAAIRGFCTSVVTWMALFSAADLLWGKFINKIPFSENSWGRIKDALPTNLAITGLFGLWDARTAYKDAEIANTHHTKLVAENRLMRTQLAQTGEVLNQVADSLTAQHDALTAKIEARTPRGTQVKPPIGSHAEKIQTEKLATMDISPRQHD